jgi:ATP-dependent Clp protease ATP-binding subunit ClpX
MQMLSVLPTPREIIAHLSRFVYGQDRAKQDLAVAVYNHYLGCKYAESPDAQYRDLDRQHVLLLGPTGSGKTHLVRTLARYLGVPVSTASATSFAETGYVGDNVTSLLQQLLSLTNGDVARAQRGIVFIDEIDKIKRGHQTGRDVSGEGVQSGLLTLLDGELTSVDTKSSGIQIDVSKILFICAGAFVGLADIIRHRLGADGPSTFGFMTAGPERSPDEMTQEELVALCETADLEEFGMIPELIGRFNTISMLEPLKKQDLKRLLLDVEGSSLFKRRKFWALHGIDLAFDEGAVDEIVERAVRLQTGARGLKRSIDRAIDAVDSRIADLAAEGVVRVTVTRATVVNGEAPKLEMADGSLIGDVKAASTLAEELRKTALMPAALSGPVAELANSYSANVSNTAGWTDAQLTDRLNAVKREHLDWDNTTGSARRWWEAFEKENEKDRLKLVVRLAEELMLRKATITEFFLCYVYSNTDNIMANLHYLDYTRLKKAEEAKKKQDGPDRPEHQ